MNIFQRAREAWSVFRGRDHPQAARDWSSPDSWGNGNQVTQFGPSYGNGGGWNGIGFGPSSADRPDRLKLKPGNEKTIINAAYNRIALDVASVEFHHAKIDDNDNFSEVIKGSIEDFMTVEANIDQTHIAYMTDLVMSMFDEGVIAEVPIECDRDESGAITDESPIQMRIGKIVQWRPQEIKVKVYNEETGRDEEVQLQKREACILENPFYSVMNQKNSIFARLARKLAILDIVDEKYGSDKLNMIVQLPYIVRTDTQRATARARIQEMQDQLEKNKLGITYVDGTEKVIQMNKPIETNLQSQIEWLTDLFFSQLCITKEILNGTADEKTMTNYMNRCIGVICTAIAAERKRKLLTVEQRKNSESIVFTQDPFKLIPVTSIADIADKLTRNAILSPNEVRGIIGYKPSNDETADQLVNRNMPIKQTPGAAETDDMEPEQEGGKTPIPLQLAQSALPKLNRQQRRQMERKKVPRYTG